MLLFLDCALHPHTPSKSATLYQTPPPHAERRGQVVLINTELWMCWGSGERVRRRDSWTGREEWDRGGALWSSCLPADVPMQPECQPDPPSAHRRTQALCLGKQIPMLSCSCSRSLLTPTVHHIPACTPNRWEKEREEREEREEL